MEVLSITILYFSMKLGWNVELADKSNHTKKKQKFPIQFTLNNSINESKSSFSFHDSLIGWAGWHLSHEMAFHILI